MSVGFGGVGQIWRVIGMDENAIELFTKHLQPIMLPDGFNLNWH